VKSGLEISKGCFCKTNDSSAVHFLIDETFDEIQGCLLTQPLNRKAGMIKGKGTCEDVIKGNFYRWPSHIE